MARKSFKAFVIEKYINYDDAFGEFARYVQKDEEFPISYNYSLIKQYLKKKGASKEILETCRETYRGFNPLI